MIMVMSCTFPVLISHSYDFLLKCLLEDFAHFSTDILTILFFTYRIFIYSKYYVYSIYTYNI